MIMLKLSRCVSRFKRAADGNAALEFAILAPFIMIPLLLGSVDLIDMLGSNRRAQNTAASIADVVSRDTEISNSERDGLWAAVDVLMYPDDDADMKIRVSSVSIVNATTARIVWSEGHNGYTARQVNSTISLPSGMMRAGTSVIVAETIYGYHSPLGFLNSGRVDLVHNAYRRSRLVDPIPRVS